MSALLEAEANAFPYGKTSDILMALWFIKWNYKRFLPIDLMAGRLNWLPGYDSAWAGFERAV